MADLLKPRSDAFENGLNGPEEPRLAYRYRLERLCILDRGLNRVGHGQLEEDLGFKRVTGDLIGFEVDFRGDEPDVLLERQHRVHVVDLPVQLEGRRKVVLRAVLVLIVLDAGRGVGVAVVVVGDGGGRAKDEGQAKDAC
ncbi:MAG: hypothetical protein IPO76_10190 [Elusimicrobia bacterium]|nr:hypothetical protein [Elusimicrobiota bacterium]